MAFCAVRVARLTIFNRRADAAVIFDAVSVVMLKISNYSGYLKGRKAQKESQLFRWQPVKKLEMLFDYWKKFQVAIFFCNLEISIFYHLCAGDWIINIQIQTTDL